jgi:hypothetical protein
MLEAIIQVKFKNGPGHTKVRSGEYELFDRRSGAPLMESSFTGLIPGAFVTMAFIVGKYRNGESMESCPRIGCGSLHVKKIWGEALIW